MNWDWSTLASIKGRKTSGQGVSGRRDRYAKATVVTTTQRKLQAYLCEAFPGQMILLSQPLARLVSVEQEARFQRYRANIPLMLDLIAYLTEECCSGQPEKCADLRAASCCPEAVLPPIPADDGKP